MEEIDLPTFIRREYPEDKSWKGFFKLWLDAKGFDYGRKDESIVDGAGDGGFDAIAYPPREEHDLKIVVIQSKCFQGIVPDHTLNKFFEGVSAFRGNDINQFEEWLDKVRSGPLRQKYKDLWQKRKQITFVLVSSGKLSQEATRRARKLRVIVEGQQEIKALFQDMLRGKTPRPDRIVLRKDSKVLPIIKNNAHHGLYVFSAHLVDFARAYQLHKNSLFAGNVRYALRNATSKDVKTGIKRTLESQPGEFAYFHNGVTVVCKRVVAKNNKVTLVSPSIVNGAQTVSYVSDMARGLPDRARILVKAIEVRKQGGFEEFETNVAMSSNTQNKVSLSDLSVIDPSLVSIERFFRARGYFLVRKKGDAPEGNVVVKIDKDRLLQLFACLDSKCGPAATKDKQSLYRNHSSRLFGSYAASVSEKKNAIFLASMDKVIKIALNSFKLAGKRGHRKKRRLSLSYFTIFTVMVRLIQDHRMWGQMRTAFFSDGLWDNEYFPRLEKDIRKVATAVLSYARRDVDRNETAFFKNGEKVSQLIKKLRRKLKNKVSFPRLK